MRKLHLLIPMVLTATAIPMVSMVGCNNGNYDYTVTLESDGILDLDNDGGILGHDYLGTISVNNEYIDKYNVPNSHKYFDVTIDGTKYDDFTVNTIGTDSNYVVGLSIKQKDLHAGAKIVIKPNVHIEHYLKFTAEEGDSRVAFNESGTIPEGTYNLQYCYSLDNPVWTNWEKETPVALNKGGSIYIRNTTSKLSVDYYNYVYFNIDVLLNKIKVSGNIMSLLNFQPLYDECFSYLFYGSNIVTSPFLPSTKLAKYCYYCMFDECWFLTSAPELPATELAEGCYSYMFCYCYSLTTAPEILPAPTLVKDCYYEMFYYCESLITPPELPATNLGENCYYQMFSCCFALATAPVLPATTLSSHCYYDMFSYCYSLTTAPELPATTLAENCYDDMFYDCESLTTAPELPATTLVYGCYWDMFNGCTALQIREQDTETEDDGFIFTCPDEEDIPEHAVARMFTSVGGTFKNGTPQSNKSYYHTAEQKNEYLTFTATEDCNFRVENDQHDSVWTNSNLQYLINDGEWTDYEMPTDDSGAVIQLNTGDTIKFKGNNPDGFCHYDEYNSFCSYYTLNFYTDDNDSGCGIISGNVMSLLSDDNFETLTKIPCDGCFYSLFDSSNISNASNLILPATELTANCYCYMFCYCYYLTDAPKLLPAETLKYGCYYEMFYDCESLTTATKIMVTKLDEYSCYYMFYGCSELKIMEVKGNANASGFIFKCPLNVFYYATYSMFADTSGLYIGDANPGYSYYWYTE